MDDIIAACMNYEGSVCEIEDFPVSDSPVWILGEQYSTQTSIEELRSDFRTKIWLTYRRGFPTLGSDSLTSDKGWGCMLRCGQMVLAEAVTRINLGRDWRWTPEEDVEIYLKIISLFEDKPISPFSIHQIALLGEQRGKKIGEWYGPNTVAQVLKKLTPEDCWNKIVINVVMDNTFVIDEIRQSAVDDSDAKCWKPLVIFIPLRLGVSDINPIYFNSLKKCLKMPQNVGIIGGKPNHALYFIGFVDDEVVYLDPHTTQESVLLGAKNTAESKLGDLTYHCNHGQRMPLKQIDPSLALCFLCSNEKEFGDLCNRFQQELIDGESSPMVELCPTRPDYMKDDNLDDFAGLELDDDHNLYSEDDEFEVLE